MSEEYEKQKEQLLKYQDNKRKQLELERIIEHKKYNIKEEFDSSDTYHDVLDHRGECKNWGENTCLKCFGGGLKKFTANLLTEKRFLDYVRPYLYDDNPIDKKELWKHIKELNEATIRIFYSYLPAKIQSTGNGKNIESMYRLIQQFTNAIVKDLGLDNENFYKEEKDRLI